MNGFVSLLHVFWVTISDDEPNSRVRGTVPGEQGDGKLRFVDVINPVLGVEELVHGLARSIGSAGAIVGHVEITAPWK